MKENVHKGHRKRVKEDFLKNGFPESVPSHKLLELLLFYSIPRCDTNEVAHRLINRFGSVSALLDASPNEILKVDGVGENTVVLLKTIMPIARKYLNDKKEEKNKAFSSVDEVCEIIANKYVGLSEETFAVTTFNSNGVMLGFDIICKGDINTVEVSMRKLIETVIARKATCVIISHNHPDGNAIPSSADIHTTRKIKSVLDNINVVLLDHIIITHNDYVSLVQSADYKHLFNRG